MKRSSLRSALASAAAFACAGVGFALMTCEPSDGGEIGGWLATMVGTKAAGALTLTLALAIMAPKQDEKR